MRSSFFFPHLGTPGRSPEHSLSVHQLREWRDAQKGAGTAPASANGRAEDGEEFGRDIVFDYHLLDWEEQQQMEAEEEAVLPPGMGL